MWGLFSSVRSLPSGRDASCVARATPCTPAEEARQRKAPFSRHPRPSRRSRSTVRDSSFRSDKTRDAFPRADIFCLCTNSLARSHGFFLERAKGGSNGPDCGNFPHTRNDSWRLIIALGARVITDSPSVPPPVRRVRLSAPRSLSFLARSDVPLVSISLGLARPAAAREEADEPPQEDDGREERLHDALDEEHRRRVLRRSLRRLDAHRLALRRELLVRLTLRQALLRHLAHRLEFDLDRPLPRRRRGRRRPRCGRTANRTWRRRTSATGSRTPRRCPL